MSGSSKAKSSNEVVLLTDNIEVTIQKLKEEELARSQRKERASQKSDVIPRSATEEVPPSIRPRPPRGGLSPLRRRNSLVPRASTGDDKLGTPPLGRGRLTEASPFRRFLVNRQRLEDGREIVESDVVPEGAESASGPGAQLLQSKSGEFRSAPGSPFWTRTSSRSISRYSTALSEASSSRLKGFDVSSFSLASAPMTSTVSPATLLPSAGVDLPPHSPGRSEEGEQVQGCFKAATPKQINGSVQSPLGWLASVLCSYQAVVHERQQHVFVVRHAERIDLVDPTWKASAQRPWDPPLSEQGKAQAYKLGALLRHESTPIHRVVCSPYQRCVETAAEMLRALLATEQELEVALKDIGAPGSLHGSWLGGDDAQCAPFVHSVSPASVGFKQQFMAQVGKRAQEVQQGAEEQQTKIARQSSVDQPQSSPVALRTRKHKQQTKVVLRAHIEPALCEIRMNDFVSPGAISDDSRMFLPRAELESMLPEPVRRSASSATHFMPPDWPEDVGEGLKRILGAGDRICEQCPDENIVLVTHSEAIQGSILRCAKKAVVYNVKSAGFVHLERTVYVDTEDEDDRGVSPWKLMTRSGSSGVYYAS